MIRKYRAWHKEHKAHFKVIQLDFFEETAVVFNEVLSIVKKVSFKEIILEQSTGLTDKNAKEIFEGDTVKTNCDDIFFIKFGEFTDTKSHDQLGFHKLYYKFFDGKYFSGEMDDIDQTSEVIGNIHENKENKNEFDIS